jgi:hypothetical protein
MPEWRRFGHDLVAKALDVSWQRMEVEPDRIDKSFVQPPVRAIPQRRDGIPRPLWVANYSAISKLSERITYN